jgi:hypothetical protein
MGGGSLLREFGNVGAGIGKTHLMLAIAHTIKNESVGFGGFEQALVA